jgi:hypothetical protein
VSTAEPLAALTFDDGPDPELTPRSWRCWPRRRRTAGHGFFDQRAASQYRSRQDIEQARGEGYGPGSAGLSGFRLRAAVRRGLVQPDVEGEAGSPVTVVSLPGRRAAASRTVASLVELAIYSFSGSRATSDTSPM